MLAEARRRLGLPVVFLHEMASDVLGRPVTSLYDLTDQQLVRLRRLFPPPPKRKPVVPGVRLRCE